MPLAPIKLVYKKIWASNPLQMKRLNASTLNNYNPNHKPSQYPNPIYKAFIQREKYTCQRTSA
jgi:hypothetical protein